MKGGVLVLQNCSSRWKIFDSVQGPVGCSRMCSPGRYRADVGMYDELPLENAFEERRCRDSCDGMTDSEANGLDGTDVDSCTVLMSCNVISGHDGNVGEEKKRRKQVEV